VYKKTSSTKITNTVVVLRILVVNAVAAVNDAADNRLGLRGFYCTSEA
jgi:hypothetical protein